MRLNGLIPTIITIRIRRIDRVASDKKGFPREAFFIETICKNESYPIFACNYHKRLEFTEIFVAIIRRFSDGNEKLFVFIGKGTKCPYTKG